MQARASLPPKRHSRSNWSLLLYTFLLRQRSTKTKVGVAFLKCLFSFFIIILASLAGIQLLKDAIEAINKVIKAKQGELNVKYEPRAVSERDDKMLNALMESLEKQNQEVAGDDDDEVEGDE
jgi:hypothetical protein